MAFQKTVSRQYTQGWVGEILNDGPVRAKPGRINAVVGAVNRIGRVFGVAGDVVPGSPSGAGTQPSQTNSFIEQAVAVGGATFFGILGIPKHYALSGTAAGGMLDPTTDLPDGTEGEFVDMGIMTVAVANWAADGGSSAVDMSTKLYYVTAAAAAKTGCRATTTADLGRIVVLPGVGSVDATVYLPVPASKLTTIIGTLAPGAETGARVQLTN